MANIVSTASEDIANKIITHADINDLRRSGTIPDVYVQTIFDDANVISTIANTIHTNQFASNSEFFQIIGCLGSMQSAAEFLDQTLLMSAKASQSSSTSGSVIQQSSAQSQIANCATWVSGSLIPWIKSLAKSAWSLISKLVTPSEWKLKGELGTGVLGLANVSIEIKFG